MRTRLIGEPDISILIVNWNAYDLVVDCVRALHDTAKTVQYEVIVVDNSQSESGRQVLRRCIGCQIEAIWNATNVGFAAANNQALRIARGRYLLLLNPDAVPLPGAIDGMVEALDRYGRIGMLGCSLINPDGRRQTSAYSLYPSLLSAAIDLTGVLSAWRAWTNHRRPRAINGYRRAAWVKGACLLTRREVMNRIGLLDERFFLYSEDADWCKRARNAGWAVATARQLTVMHRGQRSAGQVPEASVRAYYESYLAFIHKHGGEGPFGLRGALAARLLVLGATARMVGTCVGRRPGWRDRSRAYRQYIFGTSASSFELKRG